MNPIVRVIEPTGILDGTKSQEFRQEINDSLAQGFKLILIDCSAIEFMDSSGLGALVLSLKNVKAAEAQLFLCSINEQVKMLFELTNMDQVFLIFTNKEEFAQKVLHKTL